VTSWREVWNDRIWSLRAPLKGTASSTIMRRQDSSRPVLNAPSVSRMRPVRATKKQLPSASLNASAGAKLRHRQNGARPQYVAFHQQSGVRSTGISRMNMGRGRAAKDIEQAFSDYRAFPELKRTFPSLLVNIRPGRLACSSSGTKYTATTGRHHIQGYTAFICPVTS